MLKGKGGRIELTRYPFGYYAAEYLSKVLGIYADETWKNRERRYRRMERCIIELRKQKKISTMSPKNMTPEDVREFLIFRKRTISPADMIHELNALKKLLAFTENPAAEICLARYPGLKPVYRGNRRKESMDDDVYDRILERSATIEPTDFTLVRAYALVLLCLRTGTRNKEIRFAEVGDLDTNAWTLDIIHVKGEDTYGQPRTVPIHPEIRSIVLTYLLARKKWLLDNSANSQALFPSKSSSDRFLSGNGIRQIKDEVEKDLDIRFDLRMCRRTFGQRYMDAGLDIESTSVLMGHASTKTTEEFYSRKRLTKAMECARNVW